MTTAPGSRRGPSYVLSRLVDYPEKLFPRVQDDLSQLLIESA